jgi:hypothetical protein
MIDVVVRRHVLIAEDEVMAFVGHFRCYPKVFSIAKISVL